MERSVLRSRCLICLVVDGLFVSDFVDKTAFAAIKFIMPLLMILGAIGFMLGAGGSTDGCRG